MMIVVAVYSKSKKRRQASPINKFNTKNVAHINNAGMRKRRRRRETETNIST